MAAEKRKFDESVRTTGSTSKAELPKKKRKKTAPDRPQPTRMFPPIEENPVLNSKTISEVQKREEEVEKVQAINFLKHKSDSTPMKPAPPAQLLTLVGAFLTTYGLNSTSRLYTTELAARNKLDDWNMQVGKKLERGTPGLVKIYKDWYKERKERRELDTSSSDEQDDAATNTAKMVKEKQLTSADKAIGKADQTSSSGSEKSSGDSDGEVDTKDKNMLPVSKKLANGKEVTSSPGTSSSSSSPCSSSDSDADDEKDTSEEAPAKTTDSSATLEGDAAKNTKASSDTSSESPDSFSSSLSSSSSSSAPKSSKKPKKSMKSMKSKAKETTTSAATTVKRKRSSSPSNATKPAKKPQNAPFSRIPSNTKPDAKFTSNAYVPYDYADRAHHDLAVVKGKDFTKEKNKKKKGAYRGGTIDIQGKKGIKFDD